MQALTLWWITLKELLEVCAVIFPGLYGSSRAAFSQNISSCAANIVVDPRSGLQLYVKSPFRHRVTDLIVRDR